MSRLLKEPLLHFALIGGLVFALYGQVRSSDPAPVSSRVIEVSDSEVNTLERQFTLEHQRPPTRAELDMVVERWVLDEVLFQEALSMGLHREDDITRRRMIQLMQSQTDSDRVRALREQYDVRR